MVINNKIDSIDIITNLDKKTELVNNYSIQFDGVDEYVQCAHSASLNLAKTDAFSISAWVKTNYKLLGQSILSKYTNVYNCYEYMLTVDGKPRIGLYGTGAGDSIIVTGNKDIADNEWHHIVIAYDGSVKSAGVTMYCDGVPLVKTVSTDALTGTITNGQPVRIGSRYATSQFMNGKLNNIALFNGVITALQVKYLYNNGKPVDMSDMLIYDNILAYWRLGQGDTYPYCQEPINNNIGTMTNMEAGDIQGDVP